MDATSDPRQLVRLLDRRFEEYFVGSLLSVMAVIVFIDLVVRTLDLPLFMPWKQAVVLGLFIWTVWVGVAWGVREDSHFRFLAVRSRFPAWLNYGVFWLEWLTWLGFSGVVIWYSRPILEQFARAGNIIGSPIPRWLLFLSVPVGFALVVVRVLQQMVLVTRAYRAGQDIGVTTAIFEEESDRGG